MPCDRETHTAGTAMGMVIIGTIGVATVKYGLIGLFGSMAVIGAAVVALFVLTD